MRRARGAALLLVLWLIALLTALVGAFALNARIEALQGRVLSGGMQAQEVARAGIEYALVRLADTEPTTRWIADGRSYPWGFAGSRVEISVVDETGKVDLNQAQAPMLSALMQAVGVERDLAERLAGAIVDWRDPDSLTQVAGGAEDPDYAAAGLRYGAKDAPFETLGEVEQVLGMTPQVFERIEPHLTIYSGRAQPDQRYAQGPVLVALGLDPESLLAQRAGTGVTPPAGLLMATGSGTYSVASRARLPDGREAVLRTVVRAGGGLVPGSAYTTLRWQEGAASR